MANVRARPKVRQTNQPGTLIHSLAGIPAFDDTGFLTDLALFLFRALLPHGYFQEIEEVLTSIRSEKLPITVSK